MKTMINIPLNTCNNYTGGTRPPLHDVADDDDVDDGDDDDDTMMTMTMMLNTMMITMMTRYAEDYNSDDERRVIPTIKTWRRQRSLFATNR